jgi:DNA-binding MarR family transcriptional regulator
MLEFFISSKTRRKIIEMFSEYPDHRIHVRGLAKQIKEDPGNVQRELLRLEQISYLRSERQANTKVYYVNQDFIVYKELQALCLKLKHYIH